VKNNKPLTIGLISVACAIVLAVVVALVVMPAVQRHRAQLMLNDAYTGPITVANSDTVKFNGKKVDKTAPDQLALSDDGQEAKDPASVNFGTRGKSVDVFVDFSDRHSRDFLSLNRNSLKSMVESGRIILRIHPVPSTNPTGMYATQAISEVAAVAPEKTWDYIGDVIKMCATPSSNPAKTFAEAAEASGIRGVGKLNIQSGHFASWIVSGAPTDKIVLPAVYIDGKKSDNTNNTTQLRKEILGK